MTHEELIAVHSLIERERPESLVEACNLLLGYAGIPDRVKTPTEAYRGLYGAFQGFLDSDQYTEAALLIWGRKLFDPRPRSVQRIWSALMREPKVLLPGGGSQGKCLGRGTRVVMFDGSLKNAEDIKVNDVLMGDDATPRNVLGTTTGRGKLFQIIPAKGIPWVCNEHHILSLKSSANKLNGSKKSFSSHYAKGKIVDISVGAFIASSAKFKEYFKQYKSGTEFPKQELPFDPYIYGLWLGDGHSGSASLCNEDSDIYETWCNYFENLGYGIRVDKKQGELCCSYTVTNGGKSHPFRQFVLKNGGKRIRPEYLCNSRSNRLSLLAGIIDTDGWGQDCGYGVSTKYPELCEQICYLANSLGFCATSWSGIKRIKSTGFRGIYYTVRISGQNTSEIPTILKSPKSQPRRDPTCTSIRIKQINDGEYFGFSTDGNHRFLLGDFTVTHNSYTPAAWAILNWVRDPAYTSGKIVSVTESHAAANIMATMKMFHENAAIQLPGRIMDRSIDLGNGDKRASITLVALPTGLDVKGRLRGFHPIPRPSPHPTFGDKTRIFVLIDEGEDAPAGVWEGLENILSTQSAKGERNLITIVSGANPKKRESPYAQRAEYPGGWGNFNIETSEEWYGPSKMGSWFVLRIDPAKSENVLEKAEVFPGMMTYEGYMDYYRKGVTHPDYFTFGRGAWPEGTTEFNVTPSYFFNDAVGIYRWGEGEIIPVASFDAAFAEGGDNPVLTTGKYGKALGFTPVSGAYRPFPHPINVLQLEQQFLIRKDNTLIMAQEIMNYLRQLQVRPEWYVMDKTGNAFGLHDALLLQFGGILGVQWSEKATEHKILKEDTMTAEQRYSGVVSEMAFAFTTWLQYGYIKIAPMMDSTKLQAQATGRKYYYDGRGLLRVQSKIEFKMDTGGLSPDEYDSTIMLPHLIRMRHAHNAAMLPNHPTNLAFGARKGLEGIRESITARPTFYEI